MSVTATRNSYIGGRSQDPLDTMSKGGDTWNPYETSMNRDYMQKLCSPTIAVRPKTSKSFMNPYYLGDPIGISTYSDEFVGKTYTETEPIKAGTSSGVRNHRPHPDKTFSAWRLPHQEKKISEHSRSPWAKKPSTTEVQKVISSQYLSTYKGDYLGIPQGYDVKDALDVPLDWRKEIPKPLATESRFHYRPQPHATELDDVTSKYGCYSTRKIPVKGVVPTVPYAHICNQENRTQLTTYQRHFGKEYIDLSGIVSSLDPAELAHFVQNVPNEERRMLEKLAKAFRESDNQRLETKSTHKKLN